MEQDDISQNTSQAVGTSTCVTKKFTEASQVHEYNVHTSLFLPTQDIGNTGDIWMIPSTKQILVRYPLGWNEAQMAIEKNNVPAQEHPQFKGKRLDSTSLTWRNRSNFYTSTTQAYRRKKGMLDNSTDSDNVNENNPLDKRSISALLQQMPPQLESTEITPQLEFSHSAVTGPLLVNAENESLLTAHEAWTSLPISSLATASVGVEIITKLLTFPRTIVVKDPSEYAMGLANPCRVTFPGLGRPSFSTILTDLFALGKSSGGSLSDANVHNCAGGGHLNEVTIPMFWFFMQSCSEPGISSHIVRTLTAFNIFSDADTALGMTSYRMLPSPFSEDPEWHAEAHENSNLVKWDGTLTSKGAITHTHTDFCGCMQFMVHLGGKKLWILWPASDKNLEIMSHKRHDEIYARMTLETISTLEGLQCFIVDRVLQAFVVPPNHCHACLSLTSCAHTGCRIWGYPIFADFKRLVEHFLRLEGEEGIKMQPEMSRAWIEFLERHEIVGWEALVKKNPAHPMADEVSRYCQEVRARVSELLDMATQGSSRRQSKAKDEDPKKRKRGSAAEAKVKRKKP
ncbi:hypothetical protein H0H92_007242 [Tricholoma furcatifolium]|nr:hypothetical protein H0H92_007242 [Tricholoma furcatifolium]